MHCTSSPSPATVTSRYHVFLCIRACELGFCSLFCTFGIKVFAHWGWIWEANNSPFSNLLKSLPPSTLAAKKRWILRRRKQKVWPTNFKLATRWRHIQTFLVAWAQIYIHSSIPKAYYFCATPAEDEWVSCAPDAYIVVRPLVFKETGLPGVNYELLDRPVELTHLLSQEQYWVHPKTSIYSFFIQICPGRRHLRM